MVPSLLTEGHVVVGSFIDERLARSLYTMLALRHFRGEGRRDNQVPGAQSFWGDSTLDALLLCLMPDVERICGAPLLPTYCYARLYVHGDELPRHQDREACEVAATIHLGHSGAAPPPICFEPDVAVAQRPGDAVVYLGDRVDHWRDTFVGMSFGQMFLNYVRADGARRAHAFDGRHASFPTAIVDAALARAAQG